MQRPSTLTQILSFEDALQAVLAQAEELASAASTQATSLIAAAGRVLAAPVVADRDQPPFDRSTRDGFAVRAEDACRLRLIGSLRAGEQWGGPALASGEAIEIMTGAPMPSGADAVLMVEHGELRGDMLVRSPDRTLRPGENVVPQGREAQAGATLLPVGRRLAAAEIAVAASCGASQLRVYCRPDVAIVATGDELVELDAPLAAWQIRNSNSYALAALVEAAGGQTERLPIAPDTLSGLRERLDSAESADLLLLSGGVSAGKYDLVEQALAERGAEFFFTGAKIQPGKPVVFGRLPRRAGELANQRAGESAGASPWLYFFGLPGNPISTQVCFHLFVAPFLRALAGEIDPHPQFAEARLAHPVPGGPAVTRFLPAELTSSWSSVSVALVGWQGSGDMASNARANCYCVLPPHSGELAAGDAVRVLLR